MAGVCDRDGNVDQLAKQREAEADDLLDIPWWKPLGRPWDSEARKSLARIKTSLQTTRALHQAGCLSSQERLFGRLLERPLKQRSLDSLIELVYALDEALVATGDEEFLLRRRVAESLPDGDDTTLAAIEAQYQETVAHGEGTHSPPSNPGPTDAGRDATAAASAQQALLTLYEVRRFRYRRQRARRRMKSAVLVLAGAVLLTLVIALSLAVRDALNGNSSLVLLAALGGALGGTLANLFKLRDDLRRGTELRAFKPMLLAQPAVGAASGLVLLVVLEAGFLHITDQSDDTRWATVTVLAFAAGLSEALFLGILRAAGGAVSTPRDGADSGKSA